MWDIYLQSPSFKMLLQMLSKLIAGWLTLYQVLIRTLHENNDEIILKQNKQNKQNSLKHIWFCDIIYYSRSKVLWARWMPIACWRGLNLQELDFWLWRQRKLGPARLFQLLGYNQIEFQNKASRWPLYEN